MIDHGELPDILQATLVRLAEWCRLSPAELGAVCETVVETELNAGEQRE